MPKCGVCRQPTTNKIGLRSLCSVDCAILYGREQRAKRERREIKEFRAKDKTLSTLCSEVQRDVNKLVMEIHRGQPCISCGSPNVTEAGHYFHAGSKYRTSRFRFDMRNIRPQCGRCNRHAGGGNQHEYRLGYIARHGLDAFEELEEAKRIADRGELLPLTKDEVVQIGIAARRRRRELEKERF